jgi:hypothetical protein
MGIVDSSLNDGSILIIKAFYDFESPDERMTNLGNQMLPNSVWSIQKVASLVNFNKSYLAT